MSSENRNALIAAAVILGGFGLLLFYMPAIMLAIGEVSTVAAYAFAVAVVLAFFGLFWWRGRGRRSDSDSDS